MLGGGLASPARNFPSIFGDSEFFKKYPFALPNLVASTLFVSGILIGLLFLKVNTNYHALLKPLSFHSTTC
jgi:hypothetical protein